MNNSDNMKLINEDVDQKQVEIDGLKKRNDEILKSLMEINLRIHKLNTQIYSGYTTVLFSYLLLIVCIIYF